MLNNCLGIISSASVSENFGSLCAPRPSYMLPFGGRYRFVDFMLSNMVNHGIDTVAIYTGEKVRSAMDHIGDGKPWELNRRISGLHIFPPQHSLDKTVSGDINQYYLTEDFLEKTKAENIYMITQNKLAKIDLSAAYKHFLETDADVTLIYKKQKNSDIYLHSEHLVLDEDKEFINIGKNLGTSDELNLYLGAAFIKKSVFLNIIKESMESGEEKNFRRVLLQVKDELNINTFEHKGHVEDIKDTAAYYRASMNLLNDKIFEDLFFEGGAVFTRAKDEPPSLYTDDSTVHNSLIANGCIIEGEVLNSIVFRGVKIEKGAVVKDSIIMQKSIIKKDAHVVKSILDKHVTIGKDVKIVGTTSNPYVVSKNVKIRKAK